MKAKLSPGGYIAIGFAAVIILGTVLMLMPISKNEGVSLSLIDTIFVSTSAVCVTGLVTVDPAATFSVFGRTVLALLIQVGGLGVSSIGVGFIMITGKKINIRERVLVKEALNYNSFTGILSLVKSVLIITLSFEMVGMILSFFVFSRDYSFWDAIGFSIFHSVSSFNNSGFDIFGGNLAPYRNNILFNMTTCMLIIFGGLGFFVLKDIVQKKSFKKSTLHTKVVLFTTGSLLVCGTIIIKFIENVSWMEAFFFSTSARTAGFATLPVGGFTNAGLFIIIILMFIGASPGSTGGGIKTTTFFILLRSLIGASRNKTPSAFKRKLPEEILKKAFIIILLAFAVVITSTFLLCVTEPQTSFIDLFFEVVSGFGTVGLTTGITPGLNESSKIILIFTMFIGRLGPLTIASLWIFKRQSDISYAEEAITVG
ncbi:MAG: TrkH family potassium uptake protein [Eubacteriales bacterium]